MIPQIQTYLRRSGWTPQSVDSVTDELTRWDVRLRSRGITEAPTLPVALNSSASDARAHNELNLLMLQHGQKVRPSREREADAHALRNLTANRPYKP